MDYLHIKALNVSTKIGVHAWEQRINQTVLIDISIPSDFRACEDDLNKTLDYELLCHTVTEFVASKQFRLIETLAYSLAQFIQEKFQVSALTLSVSKPHAIKNAGTIQVSVTLPSN